VDKNTTPLPRCKRAELTRNENRAACVIVDNSVRSKISAKEEVNNEVRLRRNNPIEFYVPVNEEQAHTPEGLSVEGISPRTSEQLQHADPAGAIGRDEAVHM